MSSRAGLRLLAALAAAALACSFPQPSPTGIPEDAIATAVAATLAALPTEAEPAPDTPAPTPTEAAFPPPSPSPEPTATEPAPAGGISLNCDGTYQRVRIVDQGASGKTIAVDSWNGAAWSVVWELSSGDPNLKQLTDQAGYYTFGGCRSLVVVTFRHSNPQLWLELGIYEWNGAGMTQVYFNEGYYGEFSKLGDLVRFKEASSLGSVSGGPLEPCEWVTLEHTWNGTTFVQTGSLVQPVAGCVPSVTPSP
jgi:hypothetical protein